MKIGGLLLALLVILLSSIPCCTFEECDEELTEHSPKEIPGNCEENCSPFLNCNGCTGFTFQENPENKNQIFLSPSVMVISHPQEWIQGGVTPQVWQPPQVS